MSILAISDYLHMSGDDKINAAVALAHDLDDREEYPDAHTIHHAMYMIQSHLGIAITPFDELHHILKQKGLIPPVLNG